MGGWEGVISRFCPNYRIVLSLSDHVIRTHVSRQLLLRTCLQPIFRDLLQQTRNISCGSFQPSCRLHLKWGRLCLQRSSLTNLKIFANRTNQCYFGSLETTCLNTCESSGIFCDEKMLELRMRIFLVMYNIFISLT